MKGTRANSLMYLFEDKKITFRNLIKTITRRKEEEFASTPIVEGYNLKLLIILKEKLVTQAESCGHF